MCLEYIINDIISFIPILLYAELHYRPRFLFSNYYIKEPEIISDCPRRIDPFTPLPIMLLIKDAHYFPIFLKTIKIKINENNDLIIIKDFNFYINEKWWHKILNINIDNIYGNHLIKVEINYKLNNKDKSCQVHNYPNSTINYLECNFSKFKYPRIENVLYGDIHYHTNLTDDMVEFGAPIEETMKVSDAMGLDFVCNTDHSYDLDNNMDSWVKKDPKLVKWKNSRLAIKEINKIADLSSIMIPSEEVSIENRKGEIVHALILNNNKFLPGSGDSGESFLNRSSDLTTNTLYRQLEENAICIAAHPFKKIPFLERMIFKRGKWNEEDIIDDKLSGFQILNGKLDSGYYDGKKIWINLLLKGYFKFIYAGNDAHGNFNVYRQIRIPMINLSEKKYQVLGEFRTGIYGYKNNTIKTIVESLKNGNCFITNGPSIKISFHSKGNKYSIGSKVKARDGKIKIESLSSKEFGKIDFCMIYLGKIGSDKEEVFKEIININAYSLNTSFDIKVESRCYFRVELFNKTDTKSIFAITNPIWLL